MATRKTPTGPMVQRRKAPTGSRTPVKGWTLSTFDNAYHPPSWYAPVKRKPPTGPMMPAKRKPPTGPMMPAKKASTRARRSY